MQIRTEIPVEILIWAGPKLNTPIQQFLEVVVADKVPLYDLFLEVIGPKSTSTLIYLYKSIT